MKPSEVEKFLQDGWVVVDIPRPQLVHEYIAMLEHKAREITGTDCTLATLHEHVDEEGFKSLHHALADYFWQSEFSLRTADSFMDLLKDMIGLDIMVQYMPFLRLARPRKLQDNIGYHKDTQYGQTPYELAVHVPFVDLDEHSALRVISGSHRNAEEDFPFTQIETGFVKNSPEHMLGKPYAPKKLTVPEGVATVPLAAKVGQVALFTPALFHGQEMNNGSVTRVSTDIRYVHAHAPVTIKTGKTRAGYLPISTSPVHALAKEYYSAQPAAQSKMA